MSKINCPNCNGEIVYVEEEIYKCYHDVEIKDGKLIWDKNPYYSTHDDTICQRFECLSCNRRCSEEDLIRGDNNE